MPSSRREHAAGKDVQCKVCWSNEQSNENPLLNSCECDGSVRFIHFECLKHWLAQKMTRKESNNDQGKVVSFTWKSFECELCKHAYPYAFRARGQDYRLIDVVDKELPTNSEAPFLLLESLTFEKNSSRNVHVVLPELAAPSNCESNPDLHVFKMGRGHDTEVRVSDISVSRCHTLVKFNSSTGHFQLEDNLSKFGTLILSK